MKGQMRTQLDLARSMWRKTLVAIQVLTIFKKRRKANIEQRKKEETNSKRLWRRLGFKIRIFNIFTKKIANNDASQGKLMKLKRKLGKFCRNSYRLVCVQVCV